MPHSPMSKGVIYARYSSSAQRDVSIDQQISACQRFAARHDITISAIYEDRAVTGTNARRPGFQKMIQDAERADWQYVVVYTLDRFARDRYDSAVYKRKLKECGVKVLSAMENISDDPTGVLMESLLEGLAEYYSKELSQKIRRGMDDNASKCMVNGSLPLGYVRGPDGRYAIDEGEADIVREIYRRVMNGDRLVDIYSNLNARGIRTKAGSKWNRSSLDWILTNERYTGVYIYKGVRTPGGIPQIISQEIFDAVQHKLHTKKNPRSEPSQRRRRDNSIYLLTGKLFCGHCKSPMVGISGHGGNGTPHYYYTCKGRRAGGNCEKKNISREMIEQLLASAIKDAVLTDAAIDALADAAIAYQNANAPFSDVGILRSRLTETKRSLKNLLSAVESGLYSPTVQARLAELEAEQRHLTAQLTLAEEAAGKQLTRSEIVAALRLFQDGDVSCKDYQEALFDTFLVAAYVYNNSLRVVFNLGDKRSSTDIPFDIDDVEFSDVRISTSSLHQLVLYEHPLPTIMIGDLFVFETPL